MATEENIQDMRENGKEGVELKFIQQMKGFNAEFYQRIALLNLVPLAGHSDIACPIRRYQVLGITELKTNLTEALGLQ